MTLLLRVLFLFFFVGQSAFLFSQKKVTLSGYITDASSGESIVGVNIYDKSNLQNGTTSNAYGFYSLTLTPGTYTIVYSFISHEPQEIVIDLKSDLKKNVSLNLKAIQGMEVEITDKKSDANVQENNMGTIDLNMEQVKTIPALLGEVDVLKTIQLMPGVQSGGEGNAGFYVRGGGPDQNLILLDEAVVYNASHLFGFFSVFNADIVKDVELIKGGMPAMYGGRLASVLNITMKEGNMREFKGDGGIGVISSRLTLQGPIKKDTASFIVSGRRTYIDAIVNPFINDESNFKGTGYYFYDFNAKVNWKLSEKDRLFLTGYYGRDVFNYKNRDSGFEVQIPWGNATSSLRWNHLFSDKLFLNSTLVFSDYQFDFAAVQSDFEFKLHSGIRDFNGKFDFNWFPNVRHNLKFGLNYTYHIFSPNNASAKQEDTEFDLGETIHLYAHDAAVYLSDDFDVTDRLKIHAGIRYSAFQQVGPFDRFLKDASGRILDTTSYDKLESVKLYHGPEPRFAFRYTLNPKTSLKGNYTRNFQYIHLASLSAVSLPTDIWMPSTDVIKPQLGNQYSLGIFRNFIEDMYETSVEVYYKSMKNQIEYAAGALPSDNINDNVDANFVFGDGWSYGAEFFIKKRLGSLNGWLGYTWSKTMRQFESINDNEPFPAKYDRRHDFSAVLTYDINKRLVFSAVFVYGTGNAITLPVARYQIEGRIVNEYGPRNSFRMAPYHRADVSLTVKAKETKKFKSSFNFSIYNIYNRKNPYFIYFTNEGDIAKGQLKVSARQVSLFPILPSVSWNFSF